MKKFLVQIGDEQYLCEEIQGCSINEKVDITHKNATLPNDNVDSYNWGIYGKVLHNPSNLIEVDFSNSGDVEEYSLPS